MAVAPKMSMMFKRYSSEDERRAQKSRAFAAQNGTRVQLLDPMRWLQPSVCSVPGDPIPFSSWVPGIHIVHTHTHRHQTHILCTHTHTQAPGTHMVRIHTGETVIHIKNLRPSCSGEGRKMARCVNVLNAKSDNHLGTKRTRKREGIGVGE